MRILEILTDFHYNLFVLEHDNISLCFTPRYIPLLGTVPILLRIYLYMAFWYDLTAFEVK